MSEPRQYPDGNCFTIYPNGDDSFDVYMGKGIDGYSIFQYGVNADGKTTFIYLIPKEGLPITISTLINPITTEGSMPYRCGNVTGVEFLSSEQTKIEEDE